MELLAGDARCIALDVPGFGHSESPPGGFTLDSAADLLAAALRALDAAPAVVCGHSLGGPLAARLAIRHPEAVSRLVLVGPSGLAPAPDWQHRVLRAVPVYNLLQRVPFRWERWLLPIAPLRHALLALLVDNPSGVDPALVQRIVEGARGARELTPALTASFATGLDDDAPLVPVPIDAIWGTRDRMVPPSDATILEASRALGGDPLPARLRAPADGRAPGGVRRPAAAARRRRAPAKLPANARADHAGHRRPDRAVHAAFRVPDPRACRAPHRRASRRIIRCGPMRRSGSRYSMRWGTAPRAQRAATHRRRAPRDGRDAAAARCRSRGHRSAATCSSRSTRAIRRLPTTSSCGCSPTATSPTRWLPAGSARRRLSQHTLPACAAVAAYSVRIRWTLPPSTASAGCTSGRRVISPDRLEAGERLHALIVRAWVAPESRPLDDGPPALPEGDDLLPALTDSAFELLVSAPRGRPAGQSQPQTATRASSVTAKGLLIRKAAAPVVPTRRSGAPAVRA